MTVHAIDSDLTEMTDAQSGSWGELDSPYNSGAAPVNDDTDYFIQSTGCTSQALSASKSGLEFSIYYDHEADLSGTLATGECYFIWQVFLAGTGVDTWANGGLRIAIGSSTGDLTVWQSGGSDFGRNPYGGWQNIAIDTDVAGDFTDIGTPSGAEQFFASILNTVAVISKGNLHGVDAIRYGRGELIVEFGTGADPECTFQDIADDNDLIDNRWGLFQQQGVSYLWKGLMSLGNATNELEMTDANVLIFIDDTPRTYADFNKIQVNNVDTIIDWTSVSITAQNTSVDGTVLARGNFEVVDNATVTMLACTFTDMGTFIFNDGANPNTLTDTTWRRTDRITTGGATIEGCVFEDIINATTHVIVASPAAAAKISNTTFDSDGSGNGLEIGGTVADITLSGIDFIGYSTSVDANKAIYVNIATGNITINISGGSGVTADSHVRTAGAVVTIAADVTVTFDEMQDFSEVRIYAAGTSTELAGIEDATAGSPGDRSFAAAIAAATSVDYTIVSELYEIIRVEAFTWPNADQTINIAQRFDRNYDNP